MATTHGGQKDDGDRLQVHPVELVLIILAVFLAIALVRYGSDLADLAVEWLGSRIGALDDRIVTSSLL